MDSNMQLYYDYTVSPLGLVFYRTVWRQLEYIKDKNILDFGSGFGFTANFLAKENNVTALEVDQSMLDAAETPTTFTQLCGNLDILKVMPDASFDVVICHLVFEFVDNAQEILRELLRILKNDGTLSVIRHNRAGRVIQALVQDCNFDETHKLLAGAHAYSSAFGDIKYYENKDLIHWSQGRLSIDNIYGVRALASLHAAEIQNQATWVDAMLALEWELLKDQTFINIAYFNHLILKKH